MKIHLDNQNILFFKAENNGHIWKDRRNYRKFVTLGVRNILLILY